MKQKLNPVGQTVVFPHEIIFMTVDGYNYYKHDTDTCRASILLCKAIIYYLLTCTSGKYCLLALYVSIPLGTRRCCDVTDVDLASQQRRVPSALHVD